VSRHRRKGRRRAAGQGQGPPRAAPPPTSAAPRRGGVERPQAPWHPFPLVELCVLVGIVLLVLGGLSAGSDRGRLLIVCGLALGSLGGLDTAVREHWDGYRSHTTVLSAAPAVTAAALLFVAGAPWLVVVLGAGAVGAAAWAALGRVHRRG
jgi:hypothetical protein